MTYEIRFFAYLCRNNEYFNNVHPSRQANFAHSITKYREQYHGSFAWTYRCGYHRTSWFGGLHRCNCCGRNAVQYHILDVCFLENGNERNDCSGSWSKGFLWGNEFVEPQSWYCDRHFNHLVDAYASCSWRSTLVYQSIGRCSRPCAYIF